MNRKIEVQIVGSPTPPEGATALSASERLRELQPAAGAPNATLVLWHALPLIADVVERLEREHARPHLKPSDLIGCRGCNALTALRESLGAERDSAERTP